MEASVWDIAPVVTAGLRTVPRPLNLIGPDQALFNVFRCIPSSHTSAFSWPITKKLIPRSTVIRGVFKRHGSSPVAASCYWPCSGFASGILQQGRLGQRWGLAILSLRGVEPLGEPMRWLSCWKWGFVMTARREGPDAFRKFSMTTWSLGRTTSVSMLHGPVWETRAMESRCGPLGSDATEESSKKASFRLEVLSVPWREHWARACGECTVHDFSIVDLGRHLT